jgi:hypothetical protein
MRPDVEYSITVKVQRKVAALGRDTTFAASGRTVCVTPHSHSASGAALDVDGWSRVVGNIRADRHPTSMRRLAAAPIPP